MELIPKLVKWAACRVVQCKSHFAHTDTIKGIYKSDVLSSTGNFPYPWVGLWYFSYSQVRKKHIYIYINIFLI